MKDLLWRIWQRFWKDRVLDQSAMLSFYFLVSIFPLLLFLMDLLGLLLQSQHAFQETLRHHLEAVAPQVATSRLIDTTLGEVSLGGGALKLFTALLFAWWSASRGMLAVVRGIHNAYETIESRSWWKAYLVASGLTVACLLLFTGALLLLMYGGQLSDVAAHRWGGGGFVALVWHVLSGIFVLACVLAAFNLIYVWGPNVTHRRWHWLMPGTLVGVAIWLLGSFGLKLYLSVFNTLPVSYGSLGVVIVLLMWLYLSGIAVLVGAEVNSIVENASA
ncbi:MAG: YihY/virulence factor BrkB family protein [Proteobacteria bacterium]|nr:YihY/virulence factor BrkB family protein [Pseudomonadota bacterium]